MRSVAVQRQPPGHAAPSLCRLHHRVTPVPGVVASFETPPAAPDNSDRVSEPAFSLPFAAPSPFRPLKSPPMSVRCHSLAVLLAAALLAAQVRSAMRRRGGPPRARAARGRPSPGHAAARQRQGQPPQSGAGEYHTVRPSHRPRAARRRRPPLRPRGQPAAAAPKLLKGRLPPGHKDLRVVAVSTGGGAAAAAVAADGSFRFPRLAAGTYTVRCAAPWPPAPPGDWPRRRAAALTAVERRPVACSADATRVGSLGCRPRAPAAAC
jgi:hypothetical protein